MSDHKLVLPFKRPPMSANEARRAHYQVQAKAKKAVAEVVYGHAMQQGVKDLLPSVVTFTWFVPDRRRRDVDGLGPFVKAALDALVKAGAWEDDQSEFVKEVRLRHDTSDKKNPRIEILISEVSE